MVVRPSDPSAYWSAHQATSPRPMLFWRHDANGHSTLPNNFAPIDRRLRPVRREPATALAGGRQTTWLDGRGDLPG
jgi:hypothetical protein